MSKVKTFNQKQEYTADQLAAMEFINSKKRGMKPSKQDIIKPDNINLKDDAFKPKNKDKNNVYENGKIITEEDLKKEEKDAKDNIKKFSESFFKQYSEWKSKKEEEDYSFIDFDHKEYLIRLFDMDISEFSGYVTLNYEWSPILNTYKLKEAGMKSKVFPIGKILKVGKNIDDNSNEVKYNVGDIIILPSTDILGDDWNPKFLHIMQFQDSKGMKPVVPEGMEQRVSNVEIKWNNYKFIRPWVIKEEKLDSLTYLIPSSKVKGTFNI